MQGRIQILKKMLLDDVRFVSIEQAQIITRVYKETEGEIKALRRAKAFAAACREISLAIDPLELIVGNRTSSRRAGVVFPEAGVQWLDDEIENLPFRDQDRFSVREQDVKILRDEIISYWKGKTLEDFIKCGEEGEEIKRTDKVLKINQKDHAQGHILPDVSSWLEFGPSGLLKRYESAKEKESSPEKKMFFHSVCISLEGVVLFIKRYADLATQLAESTPSIETKQHLQTIAGICQKLAYNKPESFHEAVQSVWFLFVLLHLESNASSFSPGRMDQYLYPYFKKDIEQGLLTSDHALEIISCLWLKFNEIVYLRNSHSAKYFAGFPIGFNIAIGGINEKGMNAENELSFLMLKAQSILGLPQPNLSARLSKKSSIEFIDACTKVVAKGSGMPQFFNDEAVIPALMNQGVMENHALDYGIVGCVELSTNGNNLGWSDAAMFNMVKVIELAMNNGICLLTGQQLGPQTGYLSDFESYSEFEIAIEKQMNYFIEAMMKLTGYVDQKHAKVLPSPFLSSVIFDCLGKGMDVTAGGAYYNFSGIQFIQVANVADSLAAIKSSVFDERTLSAQRLMDLLSSNFANDEITRQTLLNRIPKYGNDIQWVDEIGLKWAKKFAEKISTYSNVRGGRCHTGFYTVSAHVPMGQNVAATPDGRFACTPLADGGLSAVCGRDFNGPTALLHSVSRIDSKLGSNGTLLNMKFLPSFFDTDQDIRKFSYFLKGLVKLKISHVQFNVINKQDLLQAQIEPEKYRNLTIRVAGYTAYYTELVKDLQNEIIERTEYGS